VTSTPTLLVDDDAEQRQLVAGLLARAGIAPVFEAANAEEALLAAAHRPELGLVILDIVMPARSGLDILPELHDLVPQASIVVLSNLPRHRAADLARARGATGFVEKRVPPERLVTEILVAAAVATVTADRVTAQLPAESIAARTARGIVRTALSTADQELLDSVELLVSELVTNAVLHATSAPRLDVHVGRARVRIEVFDDDATPPHTRLPNSSGIGGWGLQLVDQLASRWGSDPQPGGKVVWFEMDRSRPA
jgi:DNA-binding NarL/FixJ family response regulator